MGSVLGYYHVLDRGKGYADEHDDEGSRTYPSRTPFGARFSDRKRLQWLHTSRYFLFGLIEVKEWPYLWGYTAAQIQLMMIDEPLTVYKKSDEKTEAEKKTPEHMMEVVERWKAKKRQGKGVKLSDFLGKGADALVDSNSKENKRKD